jgi:hypothetical protein
MNDRSTVAATLAAAILTVRSAREDCDPPSNLERIAAKIYFDCLEALQQERMRRSPQTRMLSGEERRSSFS